MASNNTRAHTVRATNGDTHEVYYRTENPDAGMFIRIEESTAIENNMTIVETTVIEVIVGVTGSEWLITEPRTMAFVEITGDESYEVTQRAVIGTGEIVEA